MLYSLAMSSTDGNTKRKPKNKIPLCVDLDGTLVKTDTFYQSVFSLLKRNFLYAGLFPLWLLKGKAYVKQQISKHSPVCVDSLPYNDDILSYLREEHAQGRELYLTTGADAKTANKVAEKLNIFSGVIASDGSNNLTGKSKASFLQKKFGSGGFDYIGNETADLEVWRHASNALVASNSPKLLQEVKKIAPVSATFTNDLERATSSIVDYVKIARPDHWFKNIFVLPGVALALLFFSVPVSISLFWNLFLSLASACLVASSNYVINEVLDADLDKHHPVKKHRPVASGAVFIPYAYAEWIILGILGTALGFYVNTHVGGACLSLWIMGALYNIPPIRTKELPYLDVLSESVNNPIRLAIGWYATGISALPPATALFAYWMFGAVLMATKRFAEYRRIGDPERAANYRKSFSYYNEERLIVGTVFYISLCIMGATAFFMQHKFELILSMPFFAYLLSYYMYLGYKPDSPVQYPELLYKEKHLMTAVALCSLFVLGLFLVDIPSLREMFSPLNMR